MGKVGEDPVEPPRAEAPNVFHDDELGSNLANGAGKREPEPASSTGKPLPRARAADVLAGEPTAQDVGLREVLDPLEVPEVRDLGPPPPQDVARVRVDFTLEDNLTTEDRLDRKVEPPDPREEGANLEGTFAMLAPSHRVSNAL